MKNRFNYQSWYDKKNNDKSNLLYEKLTKAFVGRNLLNEQEKNIESFVKNFVSSYQPENDKKLIEKTRPIVEGKLSWLGIDFGTTEGKDILNFATTFTLRHFVDLQVKSEQKEIKENPSMISDFTKLMKMIFINAAKENKELFKQFSSTSRAKAGAEVLGKQIGKDFGEFGAELGRTGKQAWSDIKSGVSNLFEVAPQAAAGGAAAGGGAIVASTATSLQGAATVVAPTVGELASAEATIMAARGGQAIQMAQAGLLRAQTFKAILEGIGSMMNFSVISGTALAVLIVQCWDNIKRAFQGATAWFKSLGKVAEKGGEKLEDLTGVEKDEEEKSATPKEKGKKRPAEDLF